MVEMEGHWIDNAGDRTRKNQWIVARRWIHGDVIAIVRRRDDTLEVRRREGPGRGIVFAQYDEDWGVTPGDCVTRSLLKMLRTLMVLDELADV
jgi:hypothetical protein